MEDCAKPGRTICHVRIEMRLGLKSSFFGKSNINKSEPFLVITEMDRNRLLKDVSHTQND